MAMAILKEQEAHTDQPSTAGPSATQQLSLAHPNRIPRWKDILFAIAQDTRHDVSKPVMELWKQKLKPFSDENICRVLLDREWQFFPSIAEVVLELKALAAEHRHQQELARQAAEKAEREAAQKDWERRSVEKYGLPPGTSQRVWIMKQAMEKVKSMPSGVGK